MSERHDEELEALLSELAATPEAREALLEEHRLLEHDLSRLADPAPPADFVQAVMKRVATAPARSLSRSEIFSGIGIFVSVVLAAGAVLVAGGAGHAGVAMTLAGVLVLAREFIVGTASALEVMWRTAALPMVVALTMTTAVSLLALRRLTPATAKVTP